MNSYVDEELMNQFAKDVENLTGEKYTPPEPVVPTHYRRIGIPIVDEKGRLLVYYEEKAKEIIGTLKKVFNDFTIRPEEGEALDFAIRFIESRLPKDIEDSLKMIKDYERHLNYKAHQKDGLDKMIADCERHLNCKGCPHERECE